ncbi:MAG TPA: glycoside hydrolase family 88 protein [Acidobacteriaceae bacterium]|nr:glycoside hydrolase family 88 protein [Acidobacteriaceae bacterium]
MSSRRTVAALFAYVVLPAALLTPGIAAPAQATAPPEAAPGIQNPVRPRRAPEQAYKEVIPPSPGDLTVWPRGVSPEEIGKALAEHFVNDGAADRFSGYPYVCTFYGAMTFAEITHDDALRDRLIAKFAPMMPGGAKADRWPQRFHVDDSIVGVIPLQIAIQTKGTMNYDPKYLARGVEWADRQWGPLSPTTPPELPADVHDALVKDGLSPQSRLWVDDMYMLTMLQLEAYRATGDRKYLDRDAHEMVVYLDRLQQPNGLFFHAPDVKYFWGRGDGWFAAGMAEMLRTLPTDHPDRARIMRSYKLMMASLLKYQGADGMWRELIDDPAAWPESSSSAMFAFALITGVKHGWLDAATYAPAARRAWIAVTGYVDQNHDVTQVCTGTGKLDNKQYYLDRKRETGNLHGQAPVLWAAVALLRDGQ